MIYDVNYFISKFEAIPEDMWITGSNGWQGVDGRFCADGFCKAQAGMPSFESNKLIDLLLLLNPIHYLSNKRIKNRDCIVYSFNDGIVYGYKQGHPKQRILAALYDIKKLQEKKADPKPLHIYHAVQIPETLVEKGKELVTLN